MKSLDNFANLPYLIKEVFNSYAVLKLMQEVTGAEPRMWGDSIAGFGAYHYRYASGREGDWLLSGFSPRKLNW